jgi:hypothetical protein
MHLFVALPGCAHLDLDQRPDIRINKMVIITGTQELPVALSF